MAAAIQFDDVTLGYGRHPAVHHLDGAIKRGSLTAVVGPNGAGKSTLLKGIVGALRPLSGRILMPEADSAANDRVARPRLRSRFAYLPQVAELDRSFPISVYDLVAMGLWKQSGLFGGIARADRARIAEAIAARGSHGFRASDHQARSPGGRCSACCLPACCCRTPKLILLDEPFTAIDSRTTRDLLDLVSRWHDEARTVVAVLHDMDIVREIFPETLLIAREPIAWGETGQVLRPDNLLRARRMVEANDPFATLCERS